MRASVKQELDNFMAGVERRNPHEVEFHQAVREVAASIMPWYLEHDDYRKAQILERLTEPDRIVIFRVTWETDDGEIRANRAWRVQFNHALGPYKGGIRFHPSVNQSILKFLGFEQIFKNSLTGLPMGGAKGGSNFNPKGKSDSEVMRFCHSMMCELHRHIGEDVDVPAGDIGVGAREIGYLFGQYMRLENRWSGVLTGKGPLMGGSAVRKEATGYGCVYFCKEMLEHHEHSLEDKRVAISGSGNVAIYAAEKAIEFGAKVISVSDSNGTLYFEDGIRDEQLEGLKVLKEQRRGRLSEFDVGGGFEYCQDQSPWGLACDIAMPCATQNELTLEDAQCLVDHGCIAACEGANMPITADAAAYFGAKGVLHAPGKASNAGGVAVSGLEMTQNSMRLSWSPAEVDARLQQIMKEIHERCLRSLDGERLSYVDGANIAGFEKVAHAMLSYGAV